MNKVTVDIEEITPKKAEEYLSTNMGNRKLHSPSTIYLIKEILGGRFVLSGETIKFNEDGNLIDGQHRLSACITAEKPIPAIVVRGLSSNSRFVIDNGKPRSMRDALNISGIKYASSVTSLLKFQYIFNDNLLSWTKVKIPPTLMLPYYEKHEEGINDVFKIFSNFSNQSGNFSRKAILRFMMWRLFNSDNYEKHHDLIFSVLERLIIGTELQIKSPILKFRNILTSADHKEYFESDKTIACVLMQCIQFELGQREKVDFKMTIDSPRQIEKYFNI